MVTDSSCIFCKIIAGEIPSHKVYEDKKYLAFLDAYPINPGHVLVVPKKHEPYVFDLDAKTYAGAFALAHKIAGPIQQATKCARVCVMVEGYFVPHTHIHLVPTNTPKEIDNETKPAKSSDLEKMAQKIRKLVN